MISIYSFLCLAVTVFLCFSAEQQTPVVTECRSDSSCSVGEICESGKCILGCRTDSDCTLDKACINSRCVDPCDAQDRCGRNADCRPIVHRPHCSCKPGFDGNAYDYCKQGERELRRDIFRDYDKYARPVKDHTRAVPVNVSLALLSLKNLHVKSQLIILDTWMKLKWVDEYLTWNPAEYDNITTLHVSPSQVWIPDVSVYTASPMDKLFPIAQTQIILYNSGMVLWVPPFTISSRCPMPFRTYITSEKPFIDCNIRMGSWTSSEKMLNLQLDTDKVDLTNFQDYNYEWKLVKVVSDRESKLYPCCEEPYPFVDFNITLKKRNYYLRPGSDD